MDINLGVILWVLSFLTGRHQVVRINDQFVPTQTVPTGAPQGSVISPVPLTLFSDDCRSSHPEITYIKYSDGTVTVDTSGNSEG